MSVARGICRADDALEGVACVARDNFVTDNTGVNNTSYGDGNSEIVSIRGKRSSDIVHHVNIIDSAIGQCAANVGGTATACCSANAGNGGSRP